MIHQHLRSIALGSVLLAAGGCRFEQRPPAGPAREQAAAQAAVAAYFDGLARGAGSVVRDSALGGDSLALVRSDVQVQRDLATAWVTVRLAPGGGTALQLLTLRRSGATWVVDRIVTASR